MKISIFLLIFLLNSELVFPQQKYQVQNLIEDAISESEISNIETTPMVFFIQKYNYDGTLKEERYDTLNIPVGKILNLFFYNYIYDIPIHQELQALPIIYLNHKNDTIVRWLRPPQPGVMDSTHIPGLPIDLVLNQSHRYIYDSLGRMVEYSFSTCLTCSWMALHFRIKYDKNNNPIMIEDLSLREFFEFSYDDNSNINELIYRNKEKIIQHITIME